MQALSGPHFIPAESLPVELNKEGFKKSLKDIVAFTTKIFVMIKCLLRWTIHMQNFNQIWLLLDEKKIIWIFTKLAFQVFDVTNSAEPIVLRPYSMSL